ncbi:MAG: rod shape-determining protein MreD [Alphaproteobacteria bacterium]|nr:rod shape-determining protein MreD [Alphaproteobacteria bacterium]MCZ6609974.1 rod shape-determining protein MreD [Alphaproteobacteria bacterium]MCZ6742058.1 rod shape-determining protein MreD [Alphaproteobacteria bacterium]MCZ6813089.1 rod shape-determining protein MreD [Alphaproteobacteria bacterium]MCZ6848989.1 rod shape-determining protein MreD [Alphaproteobacteria bacterium]
MTAALWNRLDVWARRLIPAGLSVVFVLVTVVPFALPGYAAIVPMLVLASVFFWAIHHPGLLPPVAVFAIGLVQDILTGALVGSGAVVLLLVYGVIVSQRIFFRNKSFLVVWWGFMVVALGAGALNWLFASAFAGQLILPRAAAFQVLVTVAIYPLLTWILHGVHRLLPQEA